MLAQCGNWGFRALLCAGAVPSVLRPIHQCWLSLVVSHCGTLGAGRVPLCFNHIFIYDSLYLFDGDQSHCWLKRAPSLNPPLSGRYHMSDSSQVLQVPGQPTNQLRLSCSLFGIRVLLTLYLRTLFPLTRYGQLSDCFLPAD